MQTWVSRPHRMGGYEQKPYYLTIWLILSLTATITVDAQGWGQWTAYGPCSASCAGGDQTRVRHCLDQRFCSGTDVDSRNCNNNKCPVDGGWENWESWTSCTQTCGGGSTSRERSCDAPVPDFGGRFCLGGVPENIDSDGVEWQWKECNTHRCADDRRTGPLPPVILPTVPSSMTTARQF